MFSIMCLQEIQRACSALIIRKYSPQYHNIIHRCLCAKNLFHVSHPINIVWQATLVHNAYLTTAWMYVINYNIYIYIIFLIVNCLFISKYFRSSNLLKQYVSKKSPNYYDYDFYALLWEVGSGTDPPPYIMEISHD